MPKTDAHSLRNFQQKAAGDADKTEFEALVHGSAVVDAGIFDDYVADSMDDFHIDDPTGELGELLQHDITYDSAAGTLHEEIERRIHLFKGNYPFSLVRNNLIYEPSENFVYEFLLSICVAPNITSNPYTGLPRTFEHLSSQVVRRYFGAHTSVLHTGAPRRDGSSFREVMNQLSQDTGEWIWGPQPGLPEEPEDKDCGVDFVVWKPAPDGRQAGQLFLLCQCACGNDWNTKFHDLSITRLGKWFHPMCLVEPVKAFATPLSLVEGNLREASREAGLVFDRGRLTFLAAQDDCSESISEMRGEIEDLIKLVKGDKAA